MAKIRYSDEFICPKCRRHTALVRRTDGTHQAHCMICDVYYDVEIAKITNYDRIIGKSVEELAKFMGELPCCPPGADLKELCYPMDSCEGTDLQVQCWLKWLKQEADDGIL